MALNPSSFITRNPLEDFSIRHTNEMSDFAAMKLFVPHVVKNKTGSFYTYSRDHLRIKTLDAPSGAEAKQHSYSATTNTFTCKEKAVKGLVLGKDARDFDRPVADLDTEQAAQNMEALMLELEAAAYTKATTSTNYPSALYTNISAGSTWADSGGDPLSQIRASRQAVFEACGKYPNKMVMNKQALDYLKLNPSIVDRIKYTGRDVSAQILCTLFELDEIILSNAVKNTANEGAADTLATVWDDEAVLFYSDPSARLKSMTYGKMFLANNLYVKTLDAPELGRDLGAHFIETGWEYALEACATVSSSDGDFIAGALLNNVY